MHRVTKLLDQPLYMDFAVDNLYKKIAAELSHFSHNIADIVPNFSVFVEFVSSGLEKDYQYYFHERKSCLLSR